MPVTNVLAIPLGETTNGDARQAITRHFGDDVKITWLDRRDLRRGRWAAIRLLMQTRAQAAVLVARDLREKRLRLTSLILGAMPAEQRWRVDLRGNRERWSAGEHLARHAGPILRHLLACCAALVLAEPLLRIVDMKTRPRQIPTRRPENVLYLRPQLWIGLEGGGSVAHTAGVIGGLQQAGTEVHVVSSDQLAGVSAHATVVAPEVWFDSWLRELEDLAYNVTFLSDVLKAARRMRPDAIYQRHTAFNCVGALTSRVLNIPLVLEFNSSELWKGRYWGGLRLTRAAALVERINLRAADRVIVVSEVLRRDLLSQGIQASKIVVIPNAVDPNRFTPDNDGAETRRKLGLESALVVGFSGTFGAWHGIPTLARTLTLVASARPHVRWLLIGDGPLKGLVDDAIQHHRLQDRVRKVGMVKHAEVPEYLAACDVLVSPHGRQADGGEFFGSPTKLFEYMAAGRAIVASAVGQIADVLVDGSSALLVPPDDPYELAAAIIRLVDDACLRVRLGRAAREAAEQHHTWRQNAERVLDCLGAA